MKVGNKRETVITLNTKFGAWKHQIFADYLDVCHYVHHFDGRVRPPHSALQPKTYSLL